MEIEIVNSRALFVIAVIVAIVIVGMLVIVFFSHLNVKRNARNSRKLKDCIIICLCIAGVLGSISLRYWTILYKYHIKEEFLWGEMYNSDNFSDIFKEREALKQEEKKWNIEALHMEWSAIAAAKEYNVINKEILKIYGKNVSDLFGQIPSEVDQSFSIEGNREFEDKKAIFSKYVGDNAKELTEEQCKEGYEAGIEVVKVNRTSENIFQTAVLAENAHVKASMSKDTASWRDITYIAVAMQYFEMFLEFWDRNAGNGNIIDETDISFRIGKMMYRDVQVNSELDEAMIYHFVLYSYECFLYSLDAVEIDDDRYLKYLCYSGLGCLKILEYVEDDELKREICQEQLKYWEEIEALDKQNVMGKTVDGKTYEQWKEEIMNRIENKIEE